MTTMALCALVASRAKRSMIRIESNISGSDAALELSSDCPGIGFITSFQV
jgi:hypothetical protein